MAGDGKKALQPIIVKKIKKAGHAAHGGAWKIAYADFVTAMMAFFLLMWLLGSTAKGDLNGIAQYFSMPLKVALAGGNGAGNANSILNGGGKDLSRSSGQVHDGDIEKQRRQADVEAEIAVRDRARMEGLRTRLAALIANSPKLKDMQSQIRLDALPDGLRIQIVDEQNRAMFDTGSQLVKPYMRDVLQDIGNALTGLENRVILEGHTDATPYGNGERGYSNWELSADRANASRRELVAGGMPEDKLVRVTGLASSQLLLPDQPNNPTNRRISIMVLTRAAENRLLQAPQPEGAPQADAGAAPAQAAQNAAQNATHGGTAPAQPAAAHAPVAAPGARP